MPPATGRGTVRGKEPARVAEDRIARTPDSQGPPAPQGGGFPHENPNQPREYQGGRTAIVGLLVVGAVALALWLALGRGDSPTREGDFGIVPRPAYLNPQRLPVGAAVGSLAPDFELETLDGGRFRLSDWRGHPVVVNFWASWCSPCRREVPVLIRLQAQHRDAGIVFAGVNIEESRGPARGFAEEFGMSYGMPMDFSGAVTRTYLRVGPPNTFFIGPDGTIEQIFIGQAEDRDFVAAVDRMVAGLPAPLGAAQLPGLKALPTALNPDDRAVSGGAGDLAADFLLLRQDGSGAGWRLSDGRGTALLLYFSPPGCTDCAASLSGALARAAEAGYRTVIVGAAGDPPPAATHLRWEETVAALYGAHVLRIVLIDPGGAVEASLIGPEGLEEALRSGAAAPS